MRPTFRPRLVNDPFDDPALFIPLAFHNRAILFDIGDISALPPKDRLKVSHVFISHAHMDHFIGFDQLLRTLLGRQKQLHIFGPVRMLNHLIAKLSAYSWNLTPAFEHRMTIRAVEIHESALKEIILTSADGFTGRTVSPDKPHADVIEQTPFFTITAAILDHHIDAIAYGLTEPFHVNILNQGLEKEGLLPGKWLSEYKRLLYNAAAPDTPVRIDPGCFIRPEKKFSLGELSRTIARITPGQKIAYIADAGFSTGNIEKMVKLAENADHLFIEAAFLHSEKDKAAQKKHLTAFQAGTIAKWAGARQFTLFHFSPRYAGKAHLLYEEAAAAFR